MSKKNKKSTDIIISFEPPKRTAFTMDDLIDKQITLLKEELSSCQEQNSVMLEALKAIQGIEAFISDGKMKELFQKTVYPAINGQPSPTNQRVEPLKGNIKQKLDDLIHDDKPLEMVVNEAIVKIETVEEENEKLDQRVEVLKEALSEANNMLRIARATHYASDTKYKQYNDIIIKAEKALSGEESRNQLKSLTAQEYFENTSMEFYDIAFSFGKKGRVDILYSDLTDLMESFAKARNQQLEEENERLHAYIKALR